MSDPHAALRARLDKGAAALSDCAKNAARDGNHLFAVVVEGIAVDVREAIAALTPAADKDIREDLIALMSQEDNIRLNCGVFTRGELRSVRQIAERALYLLESPADRAAAVPAPEPDTPATLASEVERWRREQWTNPQLAHALMLRLLAALKPAAPDDYDALRAAPPAPERLEELAQKVFAALWDADAGVEPDCDTRGPTPEGERQIAEATRIILAGLTKAAALRARPAVLDIAEAAPAPEGLDAQYLDMAERSLEAELKHDCLNPVDQRHPLAIQAVIKRALDTIRALRARPAVPSDDERARLHEYDLIEARIGERGRTDCSTPLFIRAQNLADHWDKQPAAPLSDETLREMAGSFLLRLAQRGWVEVSNETKAETVAFARAVLARQREGA